MGKPKEELKYKGVYLIDTIIVRLKNHFDEIIIVTNNPKLYQNKDRIVLKDVKITTDILKNKGPCVGLYSGLKISKNNDNFLIACDMPYISDSYLEYLNNTSYKNALVARRGEYFEPFQAMYKKDLLEDLEDFIKGERLSLNSFIKSIDHDIIDDEIIKKFDKNNKLFSNLNDKSQWDSYIGDIYG